MKYFEINIDDNVGFPEMKINSIIQEAGNMQISYTIDKDFPDDNYIIIHSTNGLVKLVFKTEVIIELLDVIEVQSDDWFQDENIPKSSTDQPAFRWNEFENISEYNVLRTIGDGLSTDYINYIDLEFAKISTITKETTKKHTGFTLTLEASYTERSDENKILDFHTGPFRFDCKKILISFDE